VLSPLLFVIVLEALSRKFKEGLPMELLYADDLVLMQRHRNCWWRNGKSMEEKGPRINLSKRKVMKCEARFGPTENLPCGVCRKGVGSNSINTVSGSMEDVE